MANPDRWKTLGVRRACPVAIGATQRGRGAAAADERSVPPAQGEPLVAPEHRRLVRRRRPRLVQRLGKLPPKQHRAQFWWFCVIVYFIIVLLGNLNGEEQ